MSLKISSTALILCALLAISANCLDLQFSKFHDETGHHHGATDEHVILHGKAKADFPALRSSDFYSTVTVGGQSLPILFSTTADKDFIVSKSCLNCPYTAKPFDSEQELHFIQSSHVERIENGQVEGLLSYCDFKIGGESTGRIDFVLATKVKYPFQHSGVLSLSPKPDTFLYKMQEQGAIENKIFSLQYTNAHPAIKFEVSEQELASHDFYPLAGDKDSWSLALDSFAINSVELSETPLQALFDTSTDLLVLPDTTADKMTVLLQDSGLKCVKDGNNKFKCTPAPGTTTSTLPPTLTIGTDGNSYTISTSNLLGNCVTTTDNGTTSTGTFTSSNTTCTTAIAFSDKPNTVVFGQTVLRHFSTIFDAEEGRIGLAEVSEEGTTTARSSKGMFYSFLMGVAILAVLVMLTWVVQKKILKKSNRLYFEEDVHGGGVELDDA